MLLKNVSVTNQMGSKAIFPSEISHGEREAFVGSRDGLICAPASAASVIHISPGS